MDNEQSPSLVKLQTAARGLAGTLAGLKKEAKFEHETLDALISEAAAREHRRAARNQRDRDVYRTGASHEPFGGEKLDDLALTGFDFLGSFALLHLVALAIRHPYEPESALKRRLFASSVGDNIRAWGVVARFEWLKELYDAEVAAFERTRHAKNPRATWRPKRPTAGQLHLITEIARALEVALPTVVDRCAAHAWITKAGGNPRFWVAPPMPEMPTLEMNW